MILQNIYHIFKEIPESFTKMHNKCIPLFTQNEKEKNLHLNQSFSEVAVLRNDSFAIFFEDSLKFHLHIETVTRGVL